MKRLPALIFLIALIFSSSCQNEKLIEFQLVGSEFHPSISILDKQIKTSLLLTEGQNGDLAAISFESRNGIFIVKGVPVSQEHTANSIETVWHIDERDVIISVRKDSGHYNFSFSAVPDEGIVKWSFSLSATSEEYFTGLFERVVDGDQKESWKEGIEEGMDLRGQKVEMSIKPTLSLYCPFYLSSNGYGLFIDGTWPGKYDFCKTDPDRVKIEFEGPSLSGRIYISDNPAEIVKAHSRNVGPTIVPPKWAFLPWRWRDNHVHREEYYDGTPVHAPYNSELVEDILMMEAYDIPCGVYWVDRPWAMGDNGYGDFEWNPERFPNAPEMINWIHQKEIKFLLWVAPWISGEMMQEAQEKGYTQPLHAHYGVDSSNAALMDFTNPEACKWWQENGIEKMLNQGVDGFKMDRSEETVSGSREVILADGRTAREVRNDFPVLYVKTVNESCQKNPW